MKRVHRVSRAQELPEKDHRYRIPLLLDALEYILCSKQLFSLKII